jgi:hypothetical protein
VKSRKGRERSCEGASGGWNWYDWGNEEEVDEEEDERKEGWN